MPDAGLLLYLSQACWDLVLLLPGLMWPGPWSVWCLCPKEQSSGPGQDIAAGGREVPLVTLQDAPAVRSGPAAEVEKLLYLWGWEDRQLTARCCLIWWLLARRWLRLGYRSADRGA